MVGGIIQMIHSETDSYLIGNPQITFFKSVYFRHTNFAIESVQFNFNNNITSAESVATCNIPKSGGDLLHNLYLEIDLSGTVASDTSSYINWTNATAYAYVKEATIKIDNQILDKHYSEWFDIWNELTNYKLFEDGMVNKHHGKELYLRSAKTKTIPPILRMYMPLQFWFCRNPGLALPLIALQYSNLVLEFKFRNLNYLINCNGTGANQTLTPSVKLYGDLIYLDSEEKKRFAQKPHEYLIEQVQFNGKETLSTKHQLNYNHYVKEIIWVCKSKNVEERLPTGTDTIDAIHNIDGGDHNNGNDYFNYTANAKTFTEHLFTDEYYEHFSKATIILEGNERFSKRNASYFRTIQPHNHHTNVPLNREKKIYLYSFALHPEEHQPSGFLNFYKVVKAELQFDDILDNEDILIFATNYNILRISDGMGALAYVE
jgi:hypothetical protein